MNREEAIEYWEGLRKTFSSQLEKEENHFGRMHLQTTIDAIDMAISALRQQDHFREVTKKVEPLTLSELRKMDEASEPVYLYIFGSDFDSGWQIIEQITDTKILFRGKTNTYVPIKELGVSYNLYRQKPEEGTV